MTNRKVILSILAFSLAVQAFPKLEVRADTPVDLGDLSVPESRIPAWNPGVDGGIPDTSGWTNIIDVTQPPYDVVPNDGQPDGWTIETAIEDAPDYSIIYLPAGVYDLSNDVINIDRSNIVLRGDGIGATIISGVGAGNTSCGNDNLIALCGSLAESVIDWRGGYAEGSDVVTLELGHGLSTNDWIVLQQDNDVYIEVATHRKYMGHIAQVTTVVGNQVVLDRPLRHDFNPAMNPVARKMHPVEQVGIEDMTIQYMSVQISEYSIGLAQYAVNSWITGTHFHQGGNRHLRLKEVARLTLHGNEFNTLSSTIDYNHYSIALGERAQDVLIENNIFHDNFVDVEVDGGAHGNVVAYNHRAGDVCNRFVFLHGRYPHHNLVEGNDGNCHIEMDNYWGRQGPYNVIFRNRLTDTVNKGIRTHRDRGSYIIAQNTTYVGNIALGFWGEPGCSNNPPDCYPFARGHEGLWGEKNIAFGGSDYLKDSPDGTDVVYIDMEAGNSAPPGWASLEIPDSLYLTEAPDWWCQEACNFEAETGIGAFGDDFGEPGSLCKLPAQIRLEGGSCTPIVKCTDDSDCDDENVCSGLESCSAGSCIAGIPLNPDDGVACTDDSCDPITGIANVPNDALCDDNDVCTGTETCDGVLDCQPGTPLDPDDGIGCTDDSCDPITGITNVPNDALCDNTLYCDGVETCDQLLDCQAGTAVDCTDGVGCTDDSCNEGTDSCDNVPNDGLCDNTLYCDGVETCDALLDCQAGTAVDCDDAVGCTDDSCNEGTDSCDNVPNDGLCDNTLYCDGVETCDQLLDCQAGTAVDCTDAVGCTDDSCNEGTDSCDNVPNDALCDDDDVCTGTETCDAVQDCQPGTPLDPDDGIACTDDSCDPITGIANVPNHSLCDDSDACNGVEICDPLLGCQPGIPTCDDLTRDGCCPGICTPENDMDCALEVGLIAQFKFDDDISDEEATDSSGNDYHGTCSNCPTLVSGRIDNAYEFANDSRIIIPQPPIAFSEGTITAWVRLDPDQPDSAPGIADTGHGGGQAEYFDIIWVKSSGRFRADVDDGDDSCGRRYQLAEDSGTNDGNWHHVAITFVAQDTLRLYVDGVEQGSGTSLSGCEPEINPATDWTIGETTGSYINGTIDDVWIYDRALSEQEINAIMGP